MVCSFLRNSTHLVPNIIWFGTLLEAYTCRTWNYLVWNFFGSSTFLWNDFFLNFFFFFLRHFLWRHTDHMVPDNIKFNFTHRWWKWPFLSFLMFYGWAHQKRFVTSSNSEKIAQNQGFFKKTLSKYQLFFTC